MTAFLNDYSQSLIDNVLKASTQEEVRCLCDASVTSLEGQRVNAQQITLFAENSILALRRFSPMNSDIVQWSNITAARVYLNRIKKQYHPSTQ